MVEICLFSLIYVFFPPNIYHIVIIFDISDIFYAIMLGRQISACPFFQNIFNHIEVSSKDLEIVFLIFEKKKIPFLSILGAYIFVIL